MQWGQLQELSPLTPCSKPPPRASTHQEKTFLNYFLECSLKANRQIQAVFIVTPAHYQKRQGLAISPATEVLLPGPTPAAHLGQGNLP